MSGYNKDKLALIGQGITGHKTWSYVDTGDFGDIVEVAGYISNAGDMGMDTGDYLLFTMTSGTGTTTRTLVRRGSAIQIVQDTGATQGTVGLSVVVGDTS